MHIKTKTEASNGSISPIAAANPAKLPMPPRTKAPTTRRKVAYLMSRFPKLTETFVLYEMAAMEQQEIQVELYPLRRERTSVMHPEAKSWVEKAHFQPFISMAIVRVHLHFLRRKPRAYLGALGTLLRANWGSRRYLTGALALFPKVVYFAQMMAEAGVAHMHAHFASHPAAATFVIHRLTGIPYSFTAHGSDIHRDRHMLCEKVAEAAFVVTISNYNRDVILAECGEAWRDKIAVIHCGVDTSMFQNRAEPTPYEQGTGPFNIVCVGTLHEVKGQTYLLEACQLLHKRGLDVICHFAGDGPDRNALTKQTQRAGLTERVCFHGRLTQQEVVQLLQRADAVVAPSVPSSDGRREGIPVALMEAMGSGVPVVASDLSGIPELVENDVSGLLAPPRDADALADALELLYYDPVARQRFSQAGREKVLQEFDLNTNAAILARHFQQEC